LGDAACFSFYATKNLTCGEGGALACRDPEMAARVRMLRLHGMSKDAASRYSEKYRHWDMLALGWKYNLDDIHSSLLIRQLPRLEGYLRRREELARRYDQAFRSLPGVELPARPGRGALHLYTVWVEEGRRDDVLARLQEDGVGVAVNYRAIHTLSYFRESLGFRPEAFPVARRIGNRTLSLPFYPKLTDAEAEHVMGAVHRAVGA
jgi:dTDP-4-amino-4,6-dideoxygalactose transaminase